MVNAWQDAVITHISTAIWVRPGAGKLVHKNRAFHGLVINFDGNKCDYRFSDGTVLATENLSVFYLPKGSDYRITRHQAGSCYAINFDLLAPIPQKPVAVHFRNSDAVLALFKKATDAWQHGDPCRRMTAMACVYEILARMLEEVRRSYLPGSRDALLSPAMEYLHRDFAQRELSIASLAELCGITPTYFRKLFGEKHGMSPKQYLTKLRMDHADRLLHSGEFSVAEVAALCGYTEVCHFTRQFTKHFGISPARSKRKIN